ncbi:hypothetical protein NDU88_007212 [Pleurodeles waltl]|uniref:Uncharacterized protein n=1 Tax=Pleurodeles waltl TaxID=8319 RepID=A0AAV7N4Q2_PLEWA|nr:hypothetical protein NDU88_007212 [Pleurodeles waltl]
MPPGNNDSVAASSTNGSGTEPTLKARSCGQADLTVGDRESWLTGGAHGGSVTELYLVVSRWRLSGLGPWEDVRGAVSYEANDLGSVLGEAQAVVHRREAQGACDLLWPSWVEGARAGPWMLAGAAVLP